MSEIIHVGDDLSPPGDAQQRLKLEEAGHKAAFAQGAKLRNVHWNEDTEMWDMTFSQVMIVETSFNPIYISDPIITVDQLAADLAEGLKDSREPYKAEYWTEDNNG